MAVARIRQHPLKAGLGTPNLASGGQVSLTEETFDFGEVELRQSGKHSFVVSNRGSKTLVLNPGSSSCTCTVSEIKDGEVPPGKSTSVQVSWRPKVAGPFRQSVTVLTSDPARPEIVFSVKGECTRSVYAEPDELAFGQISGTEPASREVRILSRLPDRPVKIESHSMSDAGSESYFQVDEEPLSPEELHKHKGVASGVLVRITIKPGLPLGSFQQRITLSTNDRADRDVVVPVFGSVGEISIVGPGWSSERGLLDIGSVDGRNDTRRRLILLVRGSNAKEMRFKVTRVEPDFLKVTLGKTAVADSGVVSQTDLLVEIPARKLPAKFTGADNGKLGEILLEATHSHVRSLRIRVRFAVVGQT